MGYILLDMHIVYLLYTIGLILTVATAQAADSLDYDYVIKGTLPEMRLNANNEIEFSLSDNRVAKIFYSENKNKNLNLKLTFDGSSCAQKYSNPTCNMTSWLSFYFLKLLWTQHPNKKLINIPVKALGGQNNHPVVFLDWTMNFWSNLSQ